MTQARNLARLLNKQMTTYKYTASAAQTSFVDSDDAGLVLSYTPNNLIVTYNGVVLENGSEYTATNGTNVVLADAADAAAEVNIMAFQSASLGGYLEITGGTIGGNLNVTGNVGIGTDSPARRLNIVHDAGANPIQSIRNSNTSWSQYALTRYGTEGEDVRYMDFGYYRGATEPTRGLVIKSQANSTLVTFLDSGNVGIGVSPESTIKVDVNSGSMTSPMRLRFTDDNNGASNNPLHFEYKAGLEIENGYSGAAPSANGTKVAKLQFTTVTANGYGASASIMGVAESGGYNAGALVFATGSNSSGLETERMRISSTGNVGIGITNPAQLLHVQAGSTGNGTIRVGGGAGLEISHNNSGTTVQRIDSIYRTTSTDANLQLRTGILTLHTGSSSTERMRIDSVGRVTMPYQPSFLFTGTSYSQGTSVYSIIVPLTTKSNIGGHYNANTGVFHAPVAGFYVFGFWGLSYPHGAEVNAMAYFLNGVNIQTIQFAGNTSNHEMASGTLGIQLNALETIDLRYYRSSGTGYAYGGQWQMWGHLAG